MVWEAADVEVKGGHIHSWQQQEAIESTARQALGHEQVGDANVELLASQA